MKSLKDIKLENKKIIMRVDFNEPVEDRKLNNDMRIRAAIPTIEHILSKKPDILVVMSHLGRPDGERNEDLSHKIIAPKLEELTGKKVVLVEYLNDLQSLIAAPGHNSEAIYLLENIRFWKEEKEAKPSFSKKIGELFDVYVNDCFSASHRNHASIAGIPNYTKEKCMGLLMEQEYKELEKVRNEPEHPAVMVIGGAKIDTKLPVIENLKGTYEKILVGGKIANEAHDRRIELGEKILLPVDFGPAGKEGERLDIGPKTIELFQKEIAKAKTIIWNGPMGKYEEKDAAHGSKKITEAIVGNSKAHKVVGGGETLDVIQEYGKFSDFDYVSMSGGAMLEFLAGKELPGLSALE